MILGVGVDIVELKHFKSVLKKTPKFLERIFTEKERKKADRLSGNRKIAYYAKRYAGKEALSKACGTGIGEAVSWQDLEILNEVSGAPIVVFSPKTTKFLCRKFKARKIEALISLSDEKESVVAFATLTK